MTCFALYCLQAKLTRGKQQFDKLKAQSEKRKEEVRAYGRTHIHTQYNAWRGA